MRIPALIFLCRAKILPFILLLTLCTSFLVSTTSPASAQVYSAYQAPNVDSNVQQNQHTYVQSIVIEVIAAAICQLSGIDVISNNSCLTVNPASNKIGYAPSSDQPGGMLGFVTSSMGSMYAIPVHSGEYIRYMAGNFGLTEHAYADNTGFQQLDYMLRFWRVFRNIAYLGFVLAFVLIGLAIMLRVKIDPRTVMTIQNQLPKIVVTMLLITFSYAIVGFLVDMMWATTYLTINVADSIGNYDNGKPLPTSQQSINLGNISQNLIKSPFGFYSAVTQNLEDGYMHELPGDAAAGPVSIARRVGETFGDMAKAFSPLKGNGPCSLATVNIGPIQLGDKNGNIGNCVAGILNTAFQWVATVLVFFVVITAILITLFRIWFMLLRSFAYVIIYTALGPIYLFAGIFPGSTFGFEPWIRGLLSNLVIYPICIAVILMGRIFMTPSNGTLTYAPPLIGTPVAGASGLGYLIGFSFLLILPDMLTMVREALKSNPNKYIAPAILGGFQKGASVASALPSKTFGKIFEKDNAGHAKSSVGQFLLYGRGDLNHAVGGALGKVGNRARSALRFATGTANSPEGSLAFRQRYSEADTARKNSITAQNPYGTNTARDAAVRAKIELDIKTERDKAERRAEEARQAAAAGGGAGNTGGNP